MIALFLGLAFGAEWVVGTNIDSVQQAVDKAEPGDTILLGPGEWLGPVVIDKAITLGSSGGTLVGELGTTLTIRAPGVLIDGLTLRSSGDELTGPDACVWVGPEATGTVIVNSDITDCLFGIWLHEVRGVRVQDNHVVGRPDVRVPSKGNGIHLFDSEQLVVTGNTVVGARDGIYVSATDDSVISHNEVSDQRYGIHYMYSHDNVVEFNTANNNSGGIALMESRGLTIHANIARNNERQGILFRDVMTTTITDNIVENNGQGLFFFSSLDNTIRGNWIAGNQIGAKIWAGTERNVVEGNAFVSNAEQVFYIAHEDQEWGPNYWSDHLGWDQDGDGLGDRPYRNDAFMAQLLHTYPQAVLLMNSPTLELLMQMQHKLPALHVATVTDAHPLMVPTAKGTQ